MKRCISITAIILAVYDGIAHAAELVVHCQGQGPPVYLIGGGPAFTTWNLRPIQERLASRFTVCRWDMRGVGDNAALAIDPHRSALSQWLLDMENVLPPEPVVLWGHSWGALQILLFANKHPDRVSSLILSNPVDPALRSLEYIERKRFNHPQPDVELRLEDIGTPVEDLFNLRSKIASYFADAEQGWQYARGFTSADANNQLNVQIWSEYRDTPLSDGDVRRLANRVVGAIYCRDDVLQPEALTEYRRLLEDSKHHLLDECAHFPWEESPEDYYEVLFELVDGQRPTTD